MSVEELVEEEPRTRHCRRCDVEINAASARCPYCGARQFRRQPIFGWRAGIISLLAVVLAVVVTRAIVLADRGGIVYRPYRSADLVTLAPAGYHDLFLTAPHGTAAVGWVDPADAANTVTVRATRSSPQAPTSRLDALAAGLHTTVGVAVGYHGPVTFAGGLVVPELEYTQGGADFAVLTFDACGHTIAVTVTLSGSSQHVLDEFLLAIPQSANAVCDGPAFSSQDRADTAIPLS